MEFREHVGFSVVDGRLEGWKVGGERQRIRSRRLVIIVLLACTTYTVQSTQEPDTHFSHLGLNTFSL